jgi:hypothetical protein
VVEADRGSLYASGDDGSRKIMAGLEPQSKADRLKAALRENLKRRKAQARGREAMEKPQLDDAVEPNASVVRPGK